jgi:lipopolysaccharide export system protein LptA
MNLVLLLLVAALKQLVVESDYADSDGETVVLQGNVSVSHELGRVRAGEARFRKQQLPDRPYPGHEVELHERVVLDFLDGGTLTCGDAYMSTDAMKAQFFDGVRYRDDSNASSPTQEPFSLACDRMEVQLHRLSDMEEELPAERQVTIAKDKLKSASAWGNVRLLHGDAFSADCCEAHYCRQPTVEQLPDSLRTLYNPEAHHRSEMPCDMVELSRDVEMEQQGLGLMSSDGQVWVTRRLLEGKPYIDMVCCSGNTELSNDERSVTCHGALVVDRNSRQARLTSPAPDLPVLYEDALGAIHADKVVIDYGAEGEGHQLSRVLLTGNVRILSHHPDQTAGLGIQYALADSVEYDPQLEKLTLSADEGHRVLFLDEGHETKVSASGVVIKRAERLVQGIGGVRFTLNESEVGRLRESFGI